MDMLLLLLSRFSSAQLLVTPWTAAYQAPPSMGLSRQEFWSGYGYEGDTIQPASDSISQSVVKSLFISKLPRVFVKTKMPGPNLS